MDIIALIGETTEYDKKQAVEARKPKSWCKSISAFANGRGGKLIFGIADDNTIIGLENAEKDAEIISEQNKSASESNPGIYTLLSEGGRQNADDCRSLCR